MTTRTRVLIAVAAAVLLAAVAVGYVLDARSRSSDRAGAADAADAASLAPGPRIVARSTAAATRGHLISVAANDPAGARSVAGVSCARLYAAGGTGVCLRPDGDLPTYQVAVLDRDLTARREIPLVGVPNRARVSGDGRLIAWTVFVTGDSYNGGRFATRAGILDTTGGQLVATLEDFAVTLDGHPYQAADENFWGVTFAADDRTFYATMSTGGRRYLVRGDLATSTLRTIRENVECPSLSPDGTRIAYKSAVDGDPGKGWRLSVLDLGTGRVTPLAETRSVDDQPAWLDGHTIGYAVRHDADDADVWAVPADGTGAPRLLIPDAESPAALG